MTALLIALGVVVVVVLVAALVLIARNRRAGPPRAPRAIGPAAAAAARRPVRKKRRRGPSWRPSRSPNRRRRRPADLPQPAGHGPRGLQRGHLLPCARGKVDAATWDSLEEALIRADVGVQTDRRPAGRAARPGRGQGDLERGRPPGGPRRRDPLPCSTCPSSRAAALRRQAGRARRLADRRGQRRGQDDHHRQAGPPGDGGRPQRSCWPRRHLPGRRRRSAGPVGRAHRCRDRARRRGRGPQRHRLRRRRSGPPPGATTSCWPTPPAGCTPRPTWSRSSRRSAGSPAGSPATSPRSSWSSTPRPGQNAVAQARAVHRGRRR